MSRKPRLHLPGGFYHVMLRGNGGRDIFLAPDDGGHFYDLLAEGTRRFGYAVHAFCLMTNHLHLLLEAGEAPLARAMQNLAFRHARFVNARHGLSGHLFGGRYKALLVAEDAYLLELVRYLHLNPVRAGLVADPAAWRWSGHRAYLGRERLDWLTTGRVLGQLDPSPERARERYREFVVEGLGEGRRRDFHAGPADPRVLAGEEGLEAVLAALPRSAAAAPSLDAVVAAVAGAYRVTEAELAGPSRRREVSEARSVIAHIARDSGAASLSRLGRLWRRDVSTLSRNLARLEARRTGDEALAARIDACRSTILHT